MLERISTLLHSAAALASKSMLREGVAPSPLEREPIDESSLLLDIELKRIEAEIARLSAVRDQLVDQLAVNRSLVAPVRRLPRELLAEIFVQFFQEEEAFLTDPKNSRYPTEEISRYVAPVSYTWWTVARSTPVLWSNIALDSSASRMRRHFDTCLALSGTHGLDIYSHKSYSVAEVGSQLAQLAPATTRWRTLWLPHRLLSELGLSFGNFQSLEVVACNCSGRRSDARMQLEVLSHAARIRRMHLQDFESHGLQLPPCALTRLSLSGSSGSFKLVVPLVRQCNASIQHLSVSYGNDLVISPGPVGVVHVPQLISVDLSKHAHQVLPFLDAPKLDDLTLRRCADGKGNPFESLCAYLFRTTSPGKCPRRLSFLDFQRVHGISASLAFITRTLNASLERLDDLRELCVVFNAGLYYLSDGALARLGCAEDRAPLLPSLTDLTLRIGAESSWIQPIARRQLREMVQWRATTRTICGRTVAAIKRFDTDIDLSEDADSGQRSA
ncbi:uncharacterized protein SCHCODRAFT_02620577 [Schizophyllum commune H4-8]|nr:uncharacterized protein SCHCODRAFT_02620577 [Schizophyllum commune H4-8]KAI5892965.1 hypothetical protein SCHCODRAFT_02620577 [Schizophyllum commune H4-8]